MSDNLTAETVAVKIQMALDSLEKAKQDLAGYGKFIVDNDKKVQEQLVKNRSDTQDVLRKFDETNLNDIQLMSLQHMEIERKKNNEIIKMAKESQKITEDQRENIIKALSHKNEELDIKENSLLHPNFLQKLTPNLAAINNILEGMGINIGRLASGAAVVTGLFAAMGEMNKEKFATLQFAAMTGRSLSDNQNAQFQAWNTNSTMGGLGNLNLSPEEAKRISSGLMAIPGMDANQIWGGKNLADVAAFGGAGMGMSSDQTVGVIRDMMVNLKIPIKDVSDELAKLANVAHKLGDANGFIVDSSVSLAKSLRSYNIDLDTSSKLVQHFYQELSTGAMTLSDIKSLLNVGQTASMGQLAFMGQILSTNSKFSQFYKGENAIGGSEVTRRLYSGEAPIGFEAQFAGRKGQQNLDMLRDEALKITMQRAESMVPKGASDEEKEALRPGFFQSLSGLNFDVLKPQERDQLLSEIEGGKLTDKGASYLKTASEDKTIAQFEAAGKEMSKASTDVLHDILREIENISKLLGFGLLYVANRGPLTTRGREAGRHINEIVDSMFPNHETSVYSSSVSDYETGGLAGLQKYLDNSLGSYSYEGAVKDINRQVKSSGMSSNEINALKNASLSMIDGTIHIIFDHSGQEILVPLKNGTFDIRANTKAPNPKAIPVPGLIQ